MPVPDFQTLMLPILRQLAHARRTNSQLRDAMAAEFGLSEEEQQQLLPSGKQTTLMNRVNWACTYLTKAALVTRVSRATYEASERGRGVVRDPPERITIGFLRSFPEFAALRPDDIPGATVVSRALPGSPASVSQTVTDAEATPDDQITEALAAIEAKVRDDLLRSLLEALPAFFERAVIDLLLAMGYGSSAEDAGQRLGGTGDGGVDGVIREDRLGLDLIYIQAKRYRDSPVSVEELRSFAGALDDKGARKGVFITTSRFTAEAERFAERQQMKRIVLINGERLTRLMLRHDVGVRADRTIVLKRIDLAYFKPDDSV